MNKYVGYLEYQLQEGKLLDPNLNQVTISLSNLDKKRVSGCEKNMSGKKDTVNLKCNPGKIIQVDWANYGRLDGRQTCAGRRYYDEHLDFFYAHYWS